MNNNKLSSINKSSLERISSIESKIKKLEQQEIIVEHFIHAGVYTRTVLIKKDTVCVNALIKINTNVVINGCILVYNDVNHLYQGYNVLQADKNRKQVFIAIEDTYITMFFATKKTCVKEAEKEFTDDFDFLIGT